MGNLLVILIGCMIVLVERMSMVTVLFIAQPGSRILCLQNAFLWPRIWMASSLGLIGTFCLRVLSYQQSYIIFTFFFFFILYVLLFLLLQRLFSLGWIEFQMFFLVFFMTFFSFQITITKLSFSFFVSFRISKADFSTFLMAVCLCV